MWRQELRWMRHVVRAQDSELRLDRWLRRQFPALPQSFLQTQLRKRRIRLQPPPSIDAQPRLQAAQAKSLLREGCVVAVDAHLFRSKLQPVEVKLQKQRQQLTAEEREKLPRLMQRVVHQDEHFVVLNKPHGLAVQDGSALTESLARYLPSMAQWLRGSGGGQQQEQELKLVHRLDKETSGVLVLARSRLAAAKFSELLRSGAVHKTYEALVASERGDYETLKRATRVTSSAKAGRLRSCCSWIRQGHESDDNYEPDNDPDDGLDDDNVNAVDAVEVDDELIDDAAVDNRDHGTAEGPSSRFEDPNEDVGAREDPNDAAAADAAHENTRDEDVAAREGQNDAVAADAAHEKTRDEDVAAREGQNDAAAADAAHENTRDEDVAAREGQNDAVAADAAHEKTRDEDVAAREGQNDAAAADAAREDPNDAVAADAAHENTRDEDVAAREGQNDAVAADAAREKTRDEDVAAREGQNDAAAADAAREDPNDAVAADAAHENTRDEDVAAREGQNDAVAADAAREKTRDDTVEGTISLVAKFNYLY
ncbi:Ribosomal large subunit pseudouridine synthase C [Phytophthora ramorum]|uniref:Ribosomal large subunit pseudouridine synthase C n=1 Tax=Phytophthora ramorum TaxID=164328 RepID=UPI0030A70F8F|nr:Ribosomal large subunit pseudouridine synthase C [Phytophthora ramorum]